MREFDYSNFKDRGLYKFIGITMWFLPKIYRNLHIVGTENVPEHGRGLILAANHINYKDPGLIGFGVGYRHPFHFMAKQEIFNKWYTDILLRGCNSFPVKRGQKDDKAIQYAIDLVKHGKTVAMFIEGTRAKEGGLLPVKPGVGVIARETSADVLPVCLYSEQKGSLKYPLTVRFGKIIPHGQLAFDGSGSREEAQGVAQQIMDEIQKLWEKGHEIG